MRWGPCLVVGGAGGLVLLLVLALLESPESVRSPDAQSEGRAPAENRDEEALPPMPARAPAGSPDDGEAGDRLGPIPGTERWHYQEFLRRAAEDPDGFERMVDEESESEAPLQRRIALLRAAWAVRGSEALRWFAGAFVQESGAKAEPADDLRGFVVRHLASHADADSKVRHFLREEVFLGEAVGIRERRVAGRALFRAAEPDEIPALVATLAAISDATVAEAALVGLGLNDHADAASALGWLSRNHRNERIRQKAAELMRQRLEGTLEEAAED